MRRRALPLILSVLFVEAAWFGLLGYAGLRLLH